WFLIVIATLGALAYFRASLRQWTIAGFFLLVIGELADDDSLILLWLLFIAVAVILNVDGIRQSLLVEPLFRWFKKVLPPISDTEREAIDAGSVWWDGELFTGHPDWQTLSNYQMPRLTPEEQAFLDGPVEQLCRMLDDWRITQELNDLPADVWAFIKREKFFGMIIPQEYGGLGFSALAHSEAVMKISTRSISAGVTVMVPNSLGPGDLLLHYGTQEQK